MILPMQDGRIDITDFQVPLTSLILSGDNDKNLLLTVNIEEKAQLEKPVMLPPTVVQKLFTDMKTILPEELNSGLFEIKQIMELGVSCVSFGFLTSTNDLHVTVFAEHFYLALNMMRGAGII